MSDLLNVQKDFDYKNIRYVVARRDIFVERQFELWCATEAALSLERLRPRVPPTFFREQMELLNSKLVSKQISWGSPDVQSASLSDEGIRHLLWLKMKRGEGNGGAMITREIIDEIASDQPSWRRLMDIYYQQDYPDFFARLQAEREQANQDKKNPGN